jgi:hypothetical protein
MRMGEFQEVYRAPEPHRCYVENAPFDWMASGGIIQCEARGTRRGVRAHPVQPEFASDA